MRIVAKQAVVEKGDGFKNDLFGRESFGRSLLSIIRNSSEALVISIDARWGEGKTTFVKMWQDALAQEGLPSIYIDAFQNDYVDDAFLVLASNITSYAKAHSDGAGETEFRARATQVFVKLLSWSGKVAVKSLTLGAIGRSELDTLDEIKDDIVDPIADTTERLIADKLGSARQDAELADDFKKSLSVLPAKLKGNEGGRLVVIIDELDRCKPTFAIDLLERVKHLFSVPNVVFVLVMNKIQLEDAMKSVYGSNLDSRTYLQKFITVESILPKKCGGSMRSCDLKIYAERLYELHELETWDDKDLILTATTVFARVFDLSLRQLERVFTNITLIYLCHNKHSYRLPGFICFLSVLKVVDNELYQKVADGTLSYGPLADELQNRWPKFCSQAEPDAGSLTRLMNSVLFCIASDAEIAALSPQHVVHSFGSDIWRFSAGRADLRGYFCSQLNLFSPQE
ncbi:P-loop NTPase fold protein [[Empedobacter] haloabium]|uniref:P-loop NTPase fold protein n=1 Tax=[Empedobacter] haloabium TaxID=592317 RepID=A0ABZ1UFU9_9BURK